MSEDKPQLAPVSRGFWSVSFNPSPLGTLVVTLLILVVFSLCPVALGRAKKQAKKRDCTNNLKQLGLYLNLYVSKYGGEIAYPPTNSVPNFLDFLREVPTSATSIASGAHGLFVCKVAGTLSGPRALDYRYPAASRAISTETTQPAEPIACDRASNHGVDPYDSINVLLFDGSVCEVRPDQLLWSSCVGSSAEAWMQGPD